MILLDIENIEQSKHNANIQGNKTPNDDISTTTQAL